jgi:RNA polymerase sigma-70 factor (ECF subfamily)
MLYTEVNINEKELLAQAKGGSLAAFEKILYLYEKPIFNYICRLTRQKEDAEDLTQQTFIKLYKSLKSINLDKSFKSWLYKIATNTTYDWFRKKEARGRIACYRTGRIF